jgi:5-methyltetrahydropteroyltriglutamate--homocysteine methyltransferase
MELILANHSSYPRVGDGAEEQLLRRTIGQREKGEKTDRDLRAAEDRLTELALGEQIAAGLDVVTDGLVRWYDPISHLAGKLAGVRIGGLLRFFDTNFYFRQPAVHARIERTKPLVVEEFLFARSKSSRPVKAVLTGPYTLARLSIEEPGRTNGGSSGPAARRTAGPATGSDRLLEAYTAALAEEVAALAQAGAKLIQVDEPAVLKHPEDFHQLERSLAALAARKGEAELTLALYFGDAAPLYEKLQTLPVDVLSLDFTYSSALPARVAGGSARRLALGLVDGRNTRLEDADAVARQLERMARGAGMTHAYLTPSCGLEYLPRDRAQMKLRGLMTIKRAFLGSNQ